MIGACGRQQGFWLRGARHLLAAAALVAALAGCGGNVVTRLSPDWVDIRPNPTPLDQAVAACAAEAQGQANPAHAEAYCMRRHGWVAMREPVLD